MKPTIAKCPLCQGPILSCFTEDGDRHEVDANATDDGDLVTFMRRSGADWVPVVTLYEPQRHAGLPRRKSHCATCRPAPKVEQLNLVMR
jgi:hypothetical protein